MSTIKVTNIQATGETASRAVSGVAAAEIKYNTSSNVVSGSVNVSSTTDINSAADTISLTSAMSDATYRIVGAANGSDTAYNNGRWIAPYSYAASSFNIGSQVSSGSLSSSTAMNVVVHGDLA